MVDYSNRVVRYLYLHKFQFQVLSHFVILNDSEKGCDNISRGVTQIIELLQTRTSIIKFPLKHIADHILHMQWMRLVTDLQNKFTVLLSSFDNIFIIKSWGFQNSNLENIFLVNKPKTTVCSLQVVQCLPHITVSGENNCFKTFRYIRNLQFTKTGPLLSNIST